MDFVFLHRHYSSSPLWYIWKKSNRALGRGVEVTPHWSDVGRGCFLCVSSFLHIARLNWSWLWILKENTREQKCSWCNHVFRSLFWHKVEKAKCWKKKKKSSTLNALIILAQWWFPQTTIQWKWKCTAFFHHLVQNEAHIISNGNPTYGYTGDCSNVVADCKASSTADPCWRATKSDKMAYGKDLTVQMSVLSAFEQTIYVTYLLLWKVHEILLQEKH